MKLSNERLTASMKLSAVAFPVFIALALFCIPPTSSRGGGSGGDGGGGQGILSSFNWKGSGPESDFGSGSNRRSSLIGYGSKNRNSFNHGAANIRPVVYGSGLFIPSLHSSGSHGPSRHNSNDPSFSRNNGLFTFETKPTAPKLPAGDPSAPVMPELFPGLPKLSINQNRINDRRGCARPFAPLQGEINCHRTNKGMICNAKCNNGFVFYNNTSEIRMECFDSLGYWMTTNQLQECKLRCAKACENGGVCIGSGKCRCPEDYRGSQCQYHYLRCDVRNLTESNRVTWVCMHSAEETTCSVTCKSPRDFATPPAENYHCYPNGTWIPDTIPDCIDHLGLPDAA